ncbi:type 1 glutamine amidotransferase [Leisingera sp. ANG-M1]|uniref:type 1 glutamine amidotransferase n=1 Tax=Leisingera sp. ANG-M1 TaxID=1577895 RepID=UPI00068AF5F1|nr:type 1 glutamine amidotransferase [Leisingera sp. ANG-M1]
MTVILIAEGNTPEMAAGGDAGSAAFVRSFAAVAPQAEIRICAPYAGAAAKEVFAAVDGIVFTGSGVPWSVDAPEAAPLRAAMELALDSGRPIWGSCNGLQLASVVLGGAVGASPNGIEVGLARELQRTEAGRAHPMLAGRQDGWAVPCIHRDEVQRLPEGAVLLAGNAHSPVQAMAYEQGGVRFWGAQYHPELRITDVGRNVQENAVFCGHASLAADCAAAETDAGAAARLGTSPQALAPETRLRELANWVAMVTGT